VSVVGLAFAGSVAACGSDTEASVNLAPGEAVAAGAFFPLNVSDTCSGGGKINFCSSDTLVSVDAFSVADPRVARLLRMEELDEASRAPFAELVVDAKQAGSTEATIETTFDDGSQRKIATKIVVQKADRMELVHACDVREPDDQDLFPSNAEVPLSIQLLAGKTPLKGEHQRNLLAGDGVARVAGLLVSNAYVWAAPSTGGATQLTSPVIPAFKATYRSYEPAALSIDSVERKYAGSVPYHSFVAFDAKLTVDGKLPCKYPPLRLEVSTPDICDGPEGIQSWLEDSPAYGLSVRALQSGTCQFNVSVDGVDAVFPVEVEIEATDVPPPDPCEGVVCEPEVTSCPAGNDLSTRGCCASCEPVLNAERCEVERASWDELYDEQLTKATACQVDADCSPTVLVGGCRRYCYVSLHHDRTADFMNAVAEQYYTSCPSCRVEQPADCAGSPRPYCDAGQCALLP